MSGREGRDRDAGARWTPGSGVRNTVSELEFRRMLQEIGRRVAMGRHETLQMYSRAHDEQLGGKEGR